MVDVGLTGRDQSLTREGAWRRVSAERGHVMGICALGPRGRGAVAMLTSWGFCFSKVGTCSTYAVVVLRYLAAVVIRLKLNNHHKRCHIITRSEILGLDICLPISKSLLKS